MEGGFIYLIFLSIKHGPLNTLAVARRVSFRFAGVLDYITASIT